MITKDKIKKVVSNDLPIITEKEIDDIFALISRNVKYYRLNNKSEYSDEYGRITQEGLAELCQVSRSLIANIESLKVYQTFFNSCYCND